MSRITDNAQARGRAFAQAALLALVMPTLLLAMIYPDGLDAQVRGVPRMLNRENRVAPSPQRGTVPTPPREVGELRGEVKSAVSDLYEYGTTGDVEARRKLEKFLGRPLRDTSWENVPPPPPPKYRGRAFNNVPGPPPQDSQASRMLPELRKEMRELRRQLERERQENRARYDLLLKQIEQLRSMIQGLKAGTMPRR